MLLNRSRRVFSLKKFQWYFGLARLKACAHSCYGRFCLRKDCEGNKVPMHSFRVSELGVVWPSEQRNEFPQSERKWFLLSVHEYILIPLTQVLFFLPVRLINKKIHGQSILIHHIDCPCIFSRTNSFVSGALTWVVLSTALFYRYLPCLPNHI